MSSINNTSRPAVAPSTTSTTAPASTAATNPLTTIAPTTDWQGALDKNMAARKGLDKSDFQYLSPERLDNMKKAVIADMTANKGNIDMNDPDAVAKALSTSIQKQGTHEMLGKMQFDMFLSQMQSRMQELSQDMWSSDN